jgi:Shugoshin C terminus
MAAAVDIDGEPETPASLDLFSPPASGSSAAYAESRDTPPPSDLGPGNDGHRPSRRTRGSVSYAEPNLRDKMRRPTKELVDAVTGEGKTQRLSVVKLEQDSLTTAPKIKEETETDESWKNIPPTALSNVYSKSPLGDRAAARDSVQETALAQRQRRRSSIHPGGDNDLPRSGSGSATSVLLVGSRKSTQGPHKKAEQKNVSLDEAMARLDIYEFTGSSPRERNDSKIPTVKTEWQTSKTGQRSSSLMHEPGQARQDESSDGESNERLLSTSSRRRQWMTGMGASVLDTEMEDQKAGQGMRRSNSHSISSEGAERSSRSERVSARRRSMML